jgi:hypothetical protein
MKDLPLARLSPKDDRGVACSVSSTEIARHYRTPQGAATGCQHGAGVSARRTTGHRLRRRAGRGDHGHRVEPARLPARQQPWRPTARPVPVARLDIGHQSLLLRQPGGAHFPVLQVRPVGQRPGPLGPRYPVERLRCGPRSVPAPWHRRATTGVAPEQGRGTRSPRIDYQYNHLSPARNVIPNPLTRTGRSSRSR